jgi:hypothetical protein
MMMDYWTADYNRLFHAGFTYMDSLSLLEIFRYHASAIVWSGFESFTDDFLFFQAVYYVEQLNAVRTALINVVLKETTYTWYYDAII